MEGNFKGSYRTAARYMQLSANVPSLSLLDGQSITALLPPPRQRDVIDTELEPDPESEPSEREGQPTTDAQLLADAEIVNALRVFLRQIFRVNRIRSYSPEARQLMVEALRATVTKLEETP